MSSAQLDCARLDLDACTVQGERKKQRHLKEYWQASRAHRSELAMTSKGSARSANPFTGSLKQIQNSLGRPAAGYENQISFSRRSFETSWTSSSSPLLS